MSIQTHSENWVSSIREFMQLEAEAITLVANRLDLSLASIIERLLQLPGRVIFTGLGKTGCVARKAAATFCSTGTPAIFLHAGEAAHGDLGVVSADDVVVALSYSGESAEILNLMPYMQRFKIPVIALTGNPSSQLGKLADQVIDIGIPNEADDNQLAPTCSTTVALAICDALALTLARQRGFTKNQFAVFHPGGNLGRKLLITVEQIMHTDEQIPTAKPELRLRNAIVIISEKRLGVLLAIDSNRQIIGILTDGDIRRIFQSEKNPLEQPISNYITQSPRTIGVDSLAAEALQLMQQNEISVLPVVNKLSEVVGVVHIHDLLKAGVA